MPQPVYITERVYQRLTRADIALTTLQAHPHLALMSADFAEIEETLSLLDDWEERYRYIIDLGRDLPPFEAALKVPELKVRGCSSQVWIKGDWAGDGTLALTGDSDAHIVRGLMAILFALFGGRSAKDIDGIDAKAQLDALGLAGALSPTRTNGLYSMVERIKAMAAAQSESA
ncbi:MAG: SufE family protein [Pseudomonadota bacterium]